MAKTQLPEGEIMPAERNTRILTQIVGTGAYLPDKILTNQDLAMLVRGVSSEWIVEHTGIRERRIAGASEQASDMAVKAASNALEMAKTRPEELDVIIVGTISGDRLLPATACFVQEKLKAKNAYAYDVSAACAGSLYGLKIGDLLIRTAEANRVLVIGVELLTRITDWQDRDTCILFGDGAGAMVLAPSSDSYRGILSLHLRSDGTKWDLITIPAGGTQLPASQSTVSQRLHFIKMKGRDVFKFAIRSLCQASIDELKANNLSTGEIDHVIAHQANARIIHEVLEKLKVPAEKCWLNIDRYGNTSSASLPIALDEANRAGVLKLGQNILLLSIGSGMVWGAGIVRW